MLEHYYVKPSTIDRIRASWLGVQGTDEITTIARGARKRSGGDYFVCPFNLEGG